MEEAAVAGTRYVYGRSYRDQRGEGFGEPWVPEGEREAEASGLVFGARAASPEAADDHEEPLEMTLALDDPEGRTFAELTPQELGAEGERIAADVLDERGYEIVARNWHCPGGEADIVARDGTTHVLVEVKTRLAGPGRSSVPPELAVDARKRRRYRGIAAWYLHACEDPGARLRFDVVAVSITTDGFATVRHHRSAFVCDL